LPTSANLARRNLNLGYSGTEYVRLYGSYVIGSTWYFSTLFGRDYCSSRLYDAAEREELLQIVFILRKLKDLVLGMISA
jgi:hypothetical protein